MSGPLRKSPAFGISVGMEVKRNGDVIELLIEGTCRDGFVEVDHVTHEGKAAVLTTSEHCYAVELLESAAIDHEDTFDFEPYYGAED